MPVPFTSSNEALRRILDQLPAALPVVVPCAPVRKEAAGLTMPWAERLRTTEELLQLLSDAYPFTGPASPS
jgi:hypothetical protein